MLTVIAVVIGVLLPVYAIYLAWSARNGGWLQALMNVAAALGVMGFLTFVARWDVLSVYLVYVWWALVVLAAMVGLLSVRDRRWIETERPSALLWSALNPVVGLGLFAYALTGLVHDRAVDLAPPLEGGRFVVGQGGNNPLLNYHNTYAPQRFALDILALDDLGRRADGIEPSELEKYVIYGKPVVAPCDGTVVEAVNDSPGMAIGETNRDQPAGNHVVLRCKGLDITLAHMRPGTVTVAAGDTVATGQRLGEVGNSGNTTEPHLHIHAVPEGTESDGEGVPLTFGGRFLVRNDTFAN